MVDHVGADLIAHKQEYRIGLSVKTRRYHIGSNEHRSCVVHDDEIAKLEHFFRRFSLEAVCIHIACVEAEKAIHLFMMRAVDIKTYFKRIIKSYSHSYNSPSHLRKIKALPEMDYSCWTGEMIGDKLFGPPLRSYDDDAYG